jgi:hypothetical protein
MPVTRRLNFANVTSTLALFFAMSGGALAAKHYLINSTKQINPNVTRALKGKIGPTGPAGAAGAHGEEGKEGKQGAAGPAGGAVAHAKVEANGTLDIGHSKNITNAEQGKKPGFTA